MADDSVRQLVSDAIDLTGDQEDDLDDEQSGCPLPGFDPDANCSLCTVYARDTHAARSRSDRTRDDDVLDARLLDELVRKFHQVKLASRSALVRAYGEKFRALGRNHPNLAFLENVTDDEVRRHYEEDHDECAHQFRDPMRDVERTLQGVMRQAPLTLCVELKKGRNKGLRVPHPGRVHSYIETVKAYDALFPRTNKK